MRDAYHEALDAITDELVTMSGMVGTMMQQASTALLTADRNPTQGSLTRVNITRAGALKQYGRVCVQVHGQAAQRR